MSFSLSTFHWQGYDVPVKIYRENRPNARVSIGKEAVIMRFPKLMRKKDLESQKAQFVAWAKKAIEKNPGLKRRFVPTLYQTGDQLKVGRRAYTLDVIKEKRASHKARLEGRTIKLWMCDFEEGLDLHRAMVQLISRIVGQDFREEVSRRVDELNAMHFNKPIKSVRLKYTTSRWGSCSSTGNINLSTRMLFAPAIVQDYIIIHELAHLVEPNHSSNFWDVVADAMPDYREQEKWLKDNGYNCDF